MEIPTAASDTAGSAAVKTSVGLHEIFRVFFMAGAISFGGGVVAYLREYLVRASGWLSDGIAAVVTAFLLWRHVNPGILVLAGGTVYALLAH